MSEYRPRWPDFHCWFPNQAFRRYEHNKHKMVEDLDRVLDESNFPLDKFQDLMKRHSEYVDQKSDIFYHRMVLEGKELTTDDRQLVEVLSRSARECEEKLNALIDSIYQQMLDMGYSPEKLQFL